MVGAVESDLIEGETVYPDSLCGVVDKNGLSAIFIHNPKTAGTALRSVLGMKGGVSHRVPATACSELAWTRRTSIVAVRHPLLRFISGYKFHVISGYRGALFEKTESQIKNMTAGEYFTFAKSMIGSGHFRPQIDFLLRPNSKKPICDIVLRFERSDKWQKVLSRYFVGLESFSPRNVTGSGLDEFYEISRETRAATDAILRDVRRLYRVDFDVLGY